MPGTKPKPKSEWKQHPRYLTVPLEQQSRNARRNRARLRAMSRIAKDHYSDYLRYLMEEMRKVGID